VAVNRTELVEKVATAAGLEKRIAENAVKALIDTVVDETKAGSKVSIFGFGTFTPTSRAARIGRNPQTGAPVKIAASKSVRFAPASAYKSSLNTKAVKKSAAKKAAPAKKVAATKSAPAAKAAPAKKVAAKKATKATKK
jgi:DNA-binding protein HU-beta